MAYSRPLDFDMLVSAPSHLVTKSVRKQRGGLALTVPGVVNPFAFYARAVVYRPACITITCARAFRLGVIRKGPAAVGSPSLRES